MAFTNNTEIPLALAVWLVNDDYDHIKTDNYISVTSLMKPIRHIILGGRNKVQEERDLDDQIPSALGNAIHDSVEKSWVNGKHKINMKKLGYPPAVINRVLVNPTDSEIAEYNKGKSPDDRAIVVYVEQRAFRKVGKYTVGGKFDMVADGIVMDIKSTTSFTWVYGGKDEDYKLQMSLYKWMNPDKIDADFGRINFVFTDWQKASARQNPNYPQSRLRYKDIPLMTDSESQKWVENKLKLIELHQLTPEKNLPECTDEELWIGDPEYKFYLKEETFKAGGRCTKNCSTMQEAKDYQASKGGRGIIVTTVGTPKRCGYCPGFEICTQKDRYFQ
jgi:hypothetical protein